MGIKFTSHIARFSVLRGYQPVELGCAVDGSHWQAENPCGGEAELGLREILRRSSPGSVIGLFGLDEHASEQCRATITGDLPNSVDLGSRPNASGSNDGRSPTNFASSNSVLRRIADVCGLKDASEPALEMLRQMLEWSEPLVFVFDAADLESIEDRKKLCAAVVDFRNSFAKPSGKAHRYVVLMERSYFFEDMRAQVKSYLPEAKAWFRSETCYTASTFGERYLIRDHSRADDTDLNAPEAELARLARVPRTGAYERLDVGFRHESGSRQFIAGSPGAGKSVLLEGLLKTDSLNDGRTLTCGCGFSRQKGDDRIVPLLEQVCRRLCFGLGWDATFPTERRSELTLGDLKYNWVSFVGNLLQTASHWLSSPGSTSFYDRPAHERLAARKSTLQRIVIAIDALNEAHESRETCSDGAPNVGWLVQRCLGALPPRIHLLCTAWPETLKTLHTKATLDLDEDALRRDDLALFIETHIVTKREQEQLLTVGGHNFLATALVLAFIKGSSSREEIQDFFARIERAPHESGEVFASIYDGFWRRIRSTLPNRNTLRAVEIVGDLLAIGRAPLPRRLVVAVVERHDIPDPEAVTQALEHLVEESLVVVEYHGNERHYRIYHDTFAQFLQFSRREPVKADRRGLHTPDDHRNRFQLTCRYAAEWCLEQIKPWLLGELEPLDHLAGQGVYNAEPQGLLYPLRYAILHLKEASAWQQLFDLLCNVRFFAAGWNRDKYEVLRAWSCLETRTKYRAADAYQDILKTPMLDPDILCDLGRLFQDRGNIGRAREMYQKALEGYEEIENEEGLARAYSYLGDLFSTCGDLKNAKEMEKKALEILERLEDYEGVAGQHLDLGAILYTRGDLKGAENMYRKALQVYEENGVAEGVAHACGYLGDILKSRGDTGGAEEMEKKALEIFELLENYVGVAKQHLDLGSILYARGDLKGAESRYRKALKIYGENGIADGLAQAYSKLEDIFFTRGKLDEAEALQNKALQIYEKIGSKQGAAEAYSSLGMILERRGVWDGAEEMHRSALQAFEEIGYPKGRALQYDRLGIVLENRGDLDGAEKKYREALRIYEEIEDVAGKSSEYNNIAEILNKRGNLDQAQELYEKALWISTKIGTQVGVAIQYKNLGEILRARCRLGEAERMHLQALDIFQAVQDQRGIAIQCDNLGSVFAARGDRERALEWWRKAYQLFSRIGMKQQVAEVQSRIDALNDV